ncbi:MAG: hypothetical protein AXW12_07260 [Thalassospira sp. Nap_22]|uniref:DUF1127 domain-containing protein n=1 Tax=Thalassospira TaxID=168934 RepID=UPI00028725E6|nr:DUF1127 domain-containing protein [Thalassospira profundimaris]EKF07794.1 hypothetical protein TH2_12637 [Thalassospira profundimaris WP0211]KXJ56878.1 MAG: hypothetical protein AXW12_07260 [Thalassospira sp. Nap_22]BDW89198.1 hypothetical protein MACH01_19650 [Thalassospira tepidiphila]BDW96257.1 hypothetical protein MACH10_19420 [Thalassospira tepidiphila]
MVNCNDTIQLPGINVTERTVSTSKQAKQPVTWRAAIIGVMISAAEYLARLQAHSRDRHALQRLDDHMLKDVGLTRSDIEQELSKPFL